MVGTSDRDKEYIAAISAVVDHIQSHLDDELTPRRLAKVACYSPHHFHRIFRAVVGESVMDHVRRLRLERAALALLAGKEPVVGIALDAGYGAQEAFTRVFQAYYGSSPSMFRKFGLSHLIPSPCGVHFSSSGFTALSHISDPDFLSDQDLCPFHRETPTLFDNQWEEILVIATGLASNIFPIPFRPKPLENPMISELTHVDHEIETLEEEVEAAKLRLVEARRRRPREEVQDYTFLDSDGNEVRLSELFGDKDDLIVVHNMGVGCPYCTLWADGYSSILPHLVNRASFVLSSPDKPEVQKKFAANRNWLFKMVSSGEGAFTKDMGFVDDNGYQPGISTFRREEGKIYRAAKAHLGPNDDFCVVWPFFDLLEGGTKGWEPKYSY